MTSRPLEGRHSSAAPQSRGRRSWQVGQGLPTGRRYARIRTPCTVVTWLKGPVCTVAPCAVSQARTFSSASTGSPWLAHQLAYAKKSRSRGAAARVSHSNQLAAQVSQPAAGAGSGGRATSHRPVWVHGGSPDHSCGARIR